jgi:hypothetical protein
MELTMSSKLSENVLLKHRNTKRSNVKINSRKFDWNLLKYGTDGLLVSSTEIKDLTQFCLENNICKSNLLNTQFFKERVVIDKSRAFMYRIQKINKPIPINNLVDISQQKPNPDNQEQQEEQETNKPYSNDPKWTKAMNQLYNSQNGSRVDFYRAIKNLIENDQLDEIPFPITIQQLNHWFETKGK